MTLPAPILDDRSYEQLRDELKARISVYLPEWTDFGASDPGITMLELVAHLGEGLLYRFNQIPDQTRLWLLRLLQLSPYPPRQATGLVRFTATSTTTPPPLVIGGTTVYAGSVPFRVGADVTVLPFRVSAMVKAAAPLPTDEILLDEYQRVLDAADLDEEDAQPYDEVVLASDPGAPGFEPLDVRTSVDHTLWIAVHAGFDEADATRQRTALFGESSILTRNPIVLGFGTDTDFPTIDEIDRCAGLDQEAPESQRVAASGGSWVGQAEEVVPGPEPPPERPALADSNLVWQISLRSPKDPSVTEYAPVSVVRDTTDGLRRDGTVALQLPATRVGDIGVGDLPDGDLAGVDGRPPALGDGPPALFWLRVFSRLGAAPVKRLRWIGVNSADVTQVAEARPELLGLGTGLSHQELALAHTPVVSRSLQVEVLEGDQWFAWTLVETFAASRPGDRHVTLDAAAGRVRCGDSVRGRVFPSGAQVRSPSYRYGGGRGGVVKPKSITRVDGVDGVEVTNPLPTVGGEEGEPITSALERIPGELSRHDRAVTADDFRALAKITGVGRVECLARFDPTSLSFEAAGVVTVVVWPNEDPRHPDAPLADAALLRAVCRQLDERRLVTTELYVVPPTYKPVAVSVGLAVRKGYSPLGVRRWVELVIRQYLAPLPPFGPDGHGWPLGHRVHGPELEAAVLQVEGVDFVEELKVADLSTGTPVPGTVELAAWEVPELRELTVAEGPAPDPGTGGVSPPPGKSPVPVPVPKDEC